MFRRFRPRFSLRTLLIAVTLLCVYCGLWSLTASQGVSSVVESCVATFGADVNRVDYNPYDVPATPGRVVDPPSVHVTGSAPCPFVVGIELQYRPKSGGGCGFGEDACFFWFFGYQRLIPRRLPLLPPSEDDSDAAY